MDDKAGRTRYRFSHRSDDGEWLYWISAVPVSGSLSEQVSCRAAWFWSGGAR